MKPEMKQEMNIQVMQHFDENPLFVHEFTINFQPGQCSMDFKRITPQSGPAGEVAQLMMNHRVVLLDPWLAKILAEKLRDTVGDYEKKYGKIEQSKAMQQAQKDVQQVTVTKFEKPSYMG